MKIIEKKLSEIRPYEKNPRLNEEAVEYVANSIKEFGFQQPIVIDAQGVIVAGHTRYKASQKLGLEVVPCVVASGLTDEQVKAYRLADNKTAEKAVWDIDLLNDELDDIIDLDMSFFGFLEEQKETFEEIDDNEQGTTTRFEHKLKCDKIETVLTDNEYNLLLERFNEYVEENGVSFGFIGSLL